MRAKGLMLIGVVVVTWFFIIFACSVGYTERTEFELNTMKSPVILVDKSKSTFWYSVTLKDGGGKIYHWGNLSGLANSIGVNYNIGDTIEK